MPSNDLENIKAGAFESRIFDVCSAFAGSGSVVVRCLDVAFVSAESESSKPETRRSAAASATSTSGPAGLSCYVFLLLFSRPFRPLRTPAMAGVLNDLIGRQVEQPIHRRVQRVNDDGSFLVLPSTTISSHFKKKGMLPMST